MEIFQVDDALSQPQLETIKRAVEARELLVIPTDTVYGIASVPFAPEAIARLQGAKGRGEDFPPPVLVSDPAALDRLMARPGGGLTGMDATRYDMAHALVKAFWPGPLTLIVKAHESLDWDLGKTGGTIALRQPNHPVALQILAHTGPLAVTSANKHNMKPATNIDAATAYFWDKVAVYVDGGESFSGVASTIVNLMNLDDDGMPTILRRGGISRANMLQVLS